MAGGWDLRGRSAGDGGDGEGFLCFLGGGGVKSEGFLLFIYMAKERVMVQGAKRG